ncbi:hypothetical protein BOTBODRAFT_175112 [Botryobasidium botryosum FD-172 SS1]|uniref:F-box domain-containing protein n=1 Tax=Botryobasidium botryosum (strain FD-172 SS1) TaxID=930990 RepID=A0A067MEL8_BOTB1|nr:hypothetical protein BOTBODRAFT_175112 [Botryobasidium botryosum FD-172 SS1]
MEATVSQVLQLTSELAHKLALEKHRQTCTSSEPTETLQSSGLKGHEVKLLSEIRDRVVNALHEHTERQISELKQSINQLTPIYRLPNEVFLHLFKLAHYLNPQERAAWKISQVSRAWRQIALNTPQLWSRIDVLNETFVEACIARSADVPLEMKLEEPLRSSQPKNVAYHITRAQEAAAEGCVATLLSHAHRWRSLSLERVAWHTFSPLLQTPAPLLEELSLSHFPIGDLSSLEESWPRLRSLSLKHTFIPLTSPIYAGLVELRLHSVKTAVKPCHLLEALKGSPLLEVLDLKELRIEPLTNPHPPPVRLSHLRLVKIWHMQSQHAQSIFSSIHAPPSLRIRCAQRFPMGGHLGGLLPSSDSLQETLPSLSCIKEMRFVLLEYGELVLHGNAGSTPLLYLKCLLKKKKDAAAIFRSLGHELPLPNLEDLTIRGPVGAIVGADDFASVLGGLSSLRCLRLKACCPVFLSALVVSTSHRVCPSMESLTIMDSGIDEQVLISLVASRVAWDKSALKELSLSRCVGVGQATVLKLRSMVGAVVEI